MFVLAKCPRGGLHVFQNGMCVECRRTFKQVYDIKARA